MTHYAARRVEFSPIFDWGPRRSRKTSFLTFLLASLVFHAFSFYLFQIIYPPTVALLPPPARVNLIAPDSEQGRLLLRWVEAEDPALSSTTQRSKESTVPLPGAPAHVPSYSNRSVALKQLPPYQPDLRIPSAQPPGPVPLPRHPAPSPAGIVATALKFEAADGLLGKPEIPPLVFNSPTREPPAAARFRIAVNVHGVVQHCFLEMSSGNSALDEQARRHLLLCRFPALESTALTGDRLVWTSAFIEWGTDIIFPASPSATPAAP